MQNTFTNYQNADSINRTAMLPTIQQLGAQIQQRVQQYSQTQYQTLYNSYKATIDEMKTFNTTKGNKYINKIEKQLLRWRDMNITSRNKQLAEIDKTHMAIKKEIWNLKSQGTTGSEVKDENENDDDDDADDNDNDNSNNNNKDPQNTNGTNANTNSDNASQSQDTNNNTNDNSNSNTSNSATGTTHSAAQFTFNTPIALVNALSSPQSPVEEHPTPTMRSPASPTGSVNYSSGASSTSNDRFSCVIQTPGTSTTHSAEAHTELTHTPKAMGKNNHNYQLHPTPQFTSPTTTQYTRRVIYSGTFTPTDTARPEVRGKPGDKKSKKKAGDEDEQDDQDTITTGRKKRKAKRKAESDDDDQEEDEPSEEESNPDIELEPKEKGKGKDKSHDDSDDHHTLNMGLGSRGSGSAPYVPSFAGILGRILASKSASKSPSLALITMCNRSKSAPFFFPVKSLF